MKNLLRKALLFGVLAVLFSTTHAQTFVEDYSTPGSWTQVGNPSEVNVSNNKLNYNYTIDTGDKRVYKSIGFPLGQTWRLDVEFTPTVAGPSGVGHVIASLTPSTLNSYDNFTPPSTYIWNHEEAFSLIYWTKHTTTSKTFQIGVHTRSATGAYQTGADVQANLGSTYYITVERLAANQGKLSVYDDAARTIHHAGSPKCFHFEPSIGNLPYLQQGNICMGVNNGTALTATVDNLSITNNIIDPGTIGFSHYICIGQTVPGKLSNFSSAKYTGGTVNYTWEQSPDGINNWVTVAGATGASYTPPASLNTDTYYRRRLTLPCGTLSVSNVVYVKIAISNGGTIAGNQVYNCVSSVDPAILSNVVLGTDNVNAPYSQWQKSTDNINWIDIPNSIGWSYDPPAGLTVTTYYRRLTNNFCLPTFSNTVKVTVNPNTVVANAGTLQLICIGTNTTLGGTPPGTGGSGVLTYKWSPASGLNNSQIAHPIASPIATSVYTLTVTDAKGCSATGTVGVIVDNPTAIISAAGSTAICQGSAVMLTATPTGGNHYQWLKNGSPIAGATKVNYNATTPGNYQVVVTSFFGCTKTSNLLTVVVNPLPVVTISANGSTQFCDGGNVVFTASVSSAGSYTYQWYNNGIAISSATTKTFKATQNGLYSVQVINSSTGCSKLSSSTSVTVLPLPVVTLSPFSNVELDAAPFTLTGGSPANGAYSGPGVSGGIFNPASAGVGTHTITYTFKNKIGCSASASQTITVLPSCFWAIHDGGANSQTANSIVADASGNTYVAGAYSDGANKFGTVNLPAHGGGDIFIAKYNPYGSLVWAKGVGSQEADEAYNLTVDGNGNIFVAGYFRKSITFGSTTLVSKGESDIFITKYDNNGNCLWAKQIGGSDVDYARSITCDVSGNAYLIGRFAGTAFYDGGSITSVHLIDNIGYSADVIVAKYDPNGQVSWVKSFGSNAEDIGNAITVDKKNLKLDITGSFVSNINFNVVHLTALPQNAQDIFLAQLDLNNGNVQWAKRSGGPNTDYSRALKTDAVGNIYMAGEFKSVANIGGMNVSSLGDYDAFTAKFNSAGNAVWVKSFGSAQPDEAVSMDIDNDGNSFVIANFYLTINAGGTVLTSSGNQDMTVVKYDVNGNLVWAQKEGGVDYDVAKGVAVDASGNAYTTGWINSTAQFGTTTLTPNGTDIFIKKICAAKPFMRLASFSTTESDSIYNSDLNIEVYPNPASDNVFVRLLSTENSAQLKLYNCTGQIVMGKTITTNEEVAMELTNLPAGIYFILVTTENDKITKRLVIQ